MKSKRLTTLLRVVAIVIVLTFSNTSITAQQQCGIENNAFSKGEFLYYDLFFNWKFIWVKVGTASMNTIGSTYEGQDAYRAHLITRGNNKLDKVFVMRDTLISYCDESLTPLYYRKGAEEGSRYYVDELWYSYPEGKTHLKQHRINRHGEHSYQESEYEECIYDMMSIFLRARNFDATDFQVGDIIPMPISDAKSLSDSWLKYLGKETFTMEGTETKYRCLVFSFMEREKGKEHELIRFFITDDINHIPVRLDMFLSFGSAKAFLKGYKGVRHPMTSIIE